MNQNEPAGLTFRLDLLYRGHPRPVGQDLCRVALITQAQSFCTQVTQRSDFEKIARLPSTKVPLSRRANVRWYTWQHPQVVRFGQARTAASCGMRDPTILPRLSTEEL